MSMAEITYGTHAGEMADEHDSVQDESDRSSFTFAVTREVISLSNQRLPLLKLMTTIAVAYQGFLDEEKAGDSPELRSEFRVTR
jgi:hypothetical protein